MQIAILGRQHKISLAELESVLSPDNVTPVGDYAALLRTEDPLPQSRLGGTIKSGSMLARFEDVELDEVFSRLPGIVSELEKSLPEGKLQLGVSVYGFKAQKNWLLRQTLGLKKIIRNTGRSVRIIENKYETLDAAQVLYNKLTGPLGIELLVIQHGKGAIVAQTYGVQDIDAYSSRDHGRPKRDAYVGMLPPKLAQIMLNIGTPPVHSGNKPIVNTVLDPFCGTGVILQEALLMGYQVVGSDLSNRMISYTAENLDWLQNTYLPQPKGTIISIEQADATVDSWKQADELTAIICETYLGKPLSSLPDIKKLEKIMQEANKITEKFLENIQPQIKSGTRMCLALPAWYAGGERFYHLEVLDRLSDLGYNRLDLVHANKHDLLYHREDQVVARELTILEKL